MAKLEGVKTIDMTNGEITKIAYDGAEYTKVDGRAVVGDVIRASMNRTDVTKGAYYKVVRRGSRTIIDDAGDAHSNVLGENPDVFRKVAQLAPQVSAPFAEMITSKVEAVEARVTALEVAKPTQELAKGMRVKALVDGEYNDIYAGEIGRITDIDAAGGDTDDPYSIEVERDGGMLDYFRPQDLEIVTEDEEETLKVGDYAIITGKGDRGTFATHRFKIGEIVKITDADSFSDRMKAEHLDSIDFWWVFNGYMRKATAAEVSEASGTVAKATAPTKPTTGDIVVIMGNTNFSRNKVGDICKVVDNVYNDETSVSVEVIGNTHEQRYGNYTKFTEMRLATDAEKARYYDAVEVERKKAEQAEAQVAKDAVFAKAGRKPNEYRKGDIVRVVGLMTLMGDLKVGDITEINGYSTGNRYEGIEIVCFAEDRVDLTKGGR